MESVSLLVVVLSQICYEGQIIAVDTQLEMDSDLVNELLALDPSPIRLVEESELLDADVVVDPSDGSGQPLLDTMAGVALTEGEPLKPPPDSPPPQSDVPDAEKGSADSNNETADSNQADDKPADAEKVEEATASNAKPKKKTSKA